MKRTILEKRWKRRCKLSVFDSVVNPEPSCNVIPVLSSLRLLLALVAKTTLVC